MFLSAGLKTIGMGLGANGSPLSNINQLSQSLISLNNLGGGGGGGGGGGMGGGNMGGGNMGGGNMGGGNMGGGNMGGGGMGGNMSGGMGSSNSMGEFTDKILYHRSSGLWVLPCVIAH